MCSHLSSFTQKDLHFSECNKSPSIYLWDSEEKGKQQQQIKFFLAL